MKRLLLLVITSLMILTACGNGNDKNSQSNNKQQEQNSNNVKQLPLIKKFKEIIIVQSYHLKESQARGVLQDNMANSYNGEDFENGLLHLSKSVFPTDNFYIKMGSI